MERNPVKSVELEGSTDRSPILRPCPRIIVFRPVVDQLPKLDVAGSTPVARSLSDSLVSQVILALPREAAGGPA